MAVRMIRRGALGRCDLFKSLGGAFRPSVLRVALLRAFVVRGLAIGRVKG